MSNDKDASNVGDLTAALKDEERAGLVNALKNKLENLAGEHSDVLENLTPKIRRRVEVLREIQDCGDDGIYSKDWSEADQVLREVINKGCRGFWDVGIA